MPIVVAEAKAPIAVLTPINICLSQEKLPVMLGDQPNITGEIKMQSDANFINTNGGGYVDGAFYLGVSAPYGVNGSSGNRSSVFHFSASRSSGLYGQGSSVQPQSLKCLACIKV